MVSLSSLSDKPIYISHCGWGGGLSKFTSYALSQPSLKFINPSPSLACRMKPEPLSLEHKSLQDLAICPASLSTYPYALITPNFRCLSKRTSFYTWQSANPSLVEGERKKKFMQTKHVNTTWSTWPEALPTVSWGAVILGSLPHLGRL